MVFLITNNMIMMEVMINVNIKDASPSFEISEKYEQMTVIELPHKAPTIRSDLAITQYEVLYYALIL